jgi:hypothetical protein
VNTLEIKAPPRSLQSFLIRGGGISTFDTYLDSTGFVIRQAASTPVTAANSYSCTLADIKSVTIRTFGFGNAFPCIVLGRLPLPKIGDPSNLHLFATTAIQQTDVGANYGTTLTYPFISHLIEQELNSDYRYFTPYVYQPIPGVTPAGSPIGGVGSGAQGLTYQQSFQFFSVIFGGSIV